MDFIRIPGRYLHGSLHTEKGIGDIVVVVPRDTLTRIQADDSDPQIRRFGDSLAFTGWVRTL
jgi:hypothetical protein